MHSQNKLAQCWTMAIKHAMFTLDGKELSPRNLTAWLFQVCSSETIIAPNAVAAVNKIIEEQTKGLQHPVADADEEKLGNLCSRLGFLLSRITTGDPTVLMQTPQLWLKDLAKLLTNRDSKGEVALAYVTKQEQLMFHL